MALYTKLFTFIWCFTAFTLSAQILDSLENKKDIPKNFLSIQILGSPVVTFNYGRYFGLKQNKTHFTKHDLHGGIGFYNYIMDNDFDNQWLNVGYGYTLGNKKTNCRVGLNNQLGKNKRKDKWEYVPNLFIEGNVDQPFFSLGLRINGFYYKKENYSLNEINETVLKKKNILGVYPCYTSYT